MRDDREKHGRKTRETRRGPVIWWRKGGIFIVIPVLVLLLFVIIVLSRSLLPPPALCRVVSQIMQTRLPAPPPFFYEFAIKIYDPPRLSIDVSRGRVRRRLE